MRTTTFRDVLLEEIAEIKSGVGFPISMQGCESGDFPFAKVGDISNRARSGEQFISDAPNWVKNEDLSTLKFTPFPTGTIVFAKIGEAIRQNFRAVSTRPMLFDNNVMGVIPQEERVDTTYLYFYLRTLDFYHLAGKTTVPAIRKSTIEKLKIPLPPLEEQRRIAAILDKADGVRRKRKEAIRLTEELLKSTFLEMFGDPVTNPKGWEIVKLGSLVVGQLNNGIFKKNHEYGGDTPVVWVKELFSGYTIDCSESRTLTPTDEEVKKFGLTKGDILFCRSSLNREGIGFNNVFDGMDFSALFECHIIRVSLNQRKVNSIFLNYLLRFPGLRKQIIAKANTVTMSTIGQSEIKKIEFYLPPKELQDKFEIFLRKIATNRTKLENKESENLFNSLLQRAFRGEL